MTDTDSDVAENSATEPQTYRSHHRLMYLLTLLIALIGLVVIASQSGVPESWSPLRGSDFHIDLRRDVGMAGRLLLAMGLSLTIGLERERRHKPAGLRTAAMVGVGACVFALTGLYVGGSDANVASRMIQGIITGIGFLGAGTIIREQFHVEGLTTAATLWTVAGIGLAAGIGMYDLALLATAAAFIVLKLLGGLERSLLDSRKRLHKRK